MKPFILIILLFSFAGSFGQQINQTVGVSASSETEPRAVVMQLEAVQETTSTKELLSVVKIDAKTVQVNRVSNSEPVRVNENPQPNKRAAVGSEHKSPIELKRKSTAAQASTTPQSVSISIVPAAKNKN